MSRVARSQSWLCPFKNKNTRIGPFPWKRSVLQNPDRERTNQSTGICLGLGLPYNNWGISSHTLYLQTSRVLSFSTKWALRLILAGKRTQRPLVRFLVTCLSKDDGKGNGNDSREQWFDWSNEEIKIIVLHVHVLHHRKRKICPRSTKKALPILLPILQLQFVLEKTSCREDICLQTLTSHFIC